MDMEMTQTIAEWAMATLEMTGVAIIVFIAVHSLGTSLYERYRDRRKRGDEFFRIVRHRLTRGILLGLEFLVAADIINTVAVELTLESVAVLAAVVLIRTLLSFTLELEMTGRWPWQQQ